MASGRFISVVFFLFSAVPCAHMYEGIADTGVTGSGTSSGYADTKGVCALRCLWDHTCISFNFRREFTIEGKKVNICDINLARLGDDMYPFSDDTNYTDFFYFD